MKLLTLLILVIISLSPVKAMNEWEGDTFPLTLSYNSRSFWSSCDRASAENSTITHLYLNNLGILAHQDNFEGTFSGMICHVLKHPTDNYIHALYADIKRKYAAGEYTITTSAIPSITIHGVNNNTFHCDDFQDKEEEIHEFDVTLHMTRGVISSTPVGDQDALNQYLIRMTPLMLREGFSGDFPDTTFTLSTDVTNEAVQSFYDAIKHACGISMPEDGTEGEQQAGLGSRLYHAIVNGWS